jgi:microcystin-dependent protein
MSDDVVRRLAAEIKEAEPQIQLRIGVVTQIEASAPRRVKTDQTDTAWLSTDKDSSYVVGDRVWMIQQGGVFVVAGRLSGEPAGTPIGTILPFAGSTPPPGWLLADGTAISRATYATLFAATSTAYGVGNGSTTFNLPNLTNRVPVGAGGTYAVAATGGAATVTLSTANLPAHTHGTTGDHFHTANNSAGGTGVLAGSDKNVATLTSGNTSTTGDHQHASVGSGTAHENMPPYVAVLFIIRAL